MASCRRSSPGTFSGTPDQVVPFLVEYLFGPALGALILGAFLCAALSSIDSVLHVGGAALVVDLWAEWKKDMPLQNGRERLQRASIFLVAALPGWVALDPPADVVPLTAFSGALFGGCFFAALVVGLWHEKPRRASVPVSIFVGALGVMSWFPVAASRLGRQGSTSGHCWFVRIPACLHSDGVFQRRTIHATRSGESSTFGDIQH